jgi:hypothetical protein
MSARREAAVVLAMTAWVKKRISKIEEQARAVADVSYPDEKTAAVVEGKVVSYTSRVSRRPAALFTILDEPGFADWIQRRWPTEVEIAIRPAFLSSLAERAERHDGILIDDDGEVCPHVKLNDPIVYTKSYLQKCADEVLAPLLADLTLETLPGYIEHEEEQQ